MCILGFFVFCFVLSCYMGEVHGKKRKELNYVYNFFDHQFVV